MRKRSLQDGVISLLADGHWWTVGELAQTLDTWDTSVRRVIKDLERRGFVKEFDHEWPAMYGWAVHMAAAENCGACYQVP